MICKICGNSKNNQCLTVKEMMFGLRESFDYMECSNCGCLQIKEIPKDMDKYYPPENYYSMQGDEINPLLETMIRKRDKHCLLKNDFLGKLLNIKYPNPYFSKLKELGMDRDSRILDVGCGDGKFLFHLADMDFKRLQGIDPHLKDETNTENLKILKKKLDELSGNDRFDFIFFDHSFEHLQNPLETLKRIETLLSDDGFCIIRMPVKTKVIWNQYGVNWVQIDAPRHFFIHTLESFKILTGKTILKLQEVIFDSYELQFWGSEQYKKDIPLNAGNSYSKSPENSIFTPEEMEEFKVRSKMLNKENLGDQAIFILKKVEILI